MLDSLNSVAADSFFGKFLRFFLNRIPKSSVARVRGGVNRGFKWVVGTSIHRCWLGSYEKELQELLPQFVKPEMVIWDVGANAGFYTLAFSRLTGPDGAVYAFEPLAENVANLRRHLLLNHLANVRVVQAALGGHAGLTGFATGESHQRGFLDASCETYLVPTLTADEFLVSRPQAVPDLLKIDIEGAESSFLEGARALLTKHRPLILLALHGDDQRTRCYQLLTSCGYEIQDLQGTLVSDPKDCGEEILARPLHMLVAATGTQEPAAAIC